jgi:hypothetical protein
MTPNNIDRYAALRVWEAGVEKALAIIKARGIKEARAAYDSPARADRFRTPLGRVTFIPARETPYIKDPAAFLEAVREQDPDQIETRVNPDYQKTRLARLLIVNGTVYDPMTGEPVEWAGIGQGRDYLALPSSAESKAAKEQSADWVLDTVDAHLKELEPEAAPLPAEPEES